MAYALKRASSILVRPENWDCFEAHVCHSALSYEAGLRGWAGFADAHILTDPHFARLHARGSTSTILARSSLFCSTSKMGRSKLEELQVETKSAFFDLDEADEYLDFEEGDGGYEGVVASESDDNDEDGAPF